MRRTLQIKESKSRLPQANAPKHKGVRKSIRFIETNYFRPIDVKDLAAVCGLSCRGLHDAFQSHLGISPGEVLRQRRLQAAKDYLFQSEHSLATIAALSGYRSANSFWVAFRNATGFSPGCYRKRLQSL
jgi:transcriptional regulator GlxA family with amidase domain